MGGVCHYAAGGRSMEAGRSRWVEGLSLAVDVLGVGAIINLTAVLALKVFAHQLYQSLVSFLGR